MIHYDLRCGDGHEFDGWFRDSAAFDLQAGRGLLDCPVCGAHTVTRALMAPRLSRGAKRPKIIETTPDNAKPVADATPQSGAPAGALPGAMTTTSELPPMPDQVRSFLQRVRAEVERKCDYVGPNFAEEARRIHKGEAPARSIYGETSPEQAEALEDDGIDVARVPWVPRADS